MAKQVWNVLIIGVNNSFRAKKKSKISFKAKAISKIMRTFAANA
jgi:hypothetical protein